MTMTLNCSSVTLIDSFTRWRHRAGSTCSSQIFSEYSLNNHDIKQMVCKYLNLLRIWCNSMSELGSINHIYLNTGQIYSCKNSWANKECFWQKDHEWSWCFPKCHLIEVNSLCIYNQSNSLFVISLLYIGNYYYTWLKASLYTELIFYRWL